VFVDGQSAGLMKKDEPLRLPGLKPGLHTLKAVKMGYEPDGPREQMVYPGQETTVTIRIRTPVRPRKKAAVEEFDRGVEDYLKGYEKNYRSAAAHLEKALALEPRYSQAALYLGRTYNALFEHEQAKKCFRLATEIDPDYVEARAGFGGMLLDLGDLDEAVRQLNVAVRHDPSHATAQYLIGQAYLRKEAFEQALEAGRAAVRLDPKKAESHFVVADSLRLLGSRYQKSGDEKRAAAAFEEAIREYNEYLRLSDFDSKLAGKLDYYVLGFLIGRGKKTRAAQEDIWKDLRSLAYAGIGDAERLLARPGRAIPYLQKALAYDRNDALVHFSLALAFTRKAELAASPEPLPAARRHFRATLEINENLEESGRAKTYIAKIDKLLAAR
jgi:tetratricopeptide (TPR) repeat protein